MLSDSNVRKINTQIERELRTVDGIFTSNEDKLAALDRIERLKGLLSPQPSTREIMNQFVSALEEQKVTRRNEPTLGDVIANFLR